MDFVLIYVKNIDIINKKLILFNDVELDLLDHDPTDQQLINSIQQVNHIPRSVSVQAIQPMLNNLLLKDRKEVDIKAIKLAWLRTKKKKLLSEPSQASLLNTNK